MRKFFFSASLFLAFLNFSALRMEAYEFKKFSFEAEAALGLKAGVVSEYVYAGQETLSRLDWQNNTLTGGSLSLYFSLWNAFLRGSVAAGLPLKVGIMEDFDFMTLTQNPTHYSKHDLRSDLFVDLSLNAGYKFALRKVDVLPSLGFAYRSQKWTASDGFAQYSSDSSPWELKGSEPKKPFEGDVIDYDQRIYLLSAGADLRWHLSRQLNIFLGAHFYPYMFAETLDRHLVRSIQFYDVMNGGLGFWLSAGVELRGVFLQVKYEYFKSFYGQSYQGAVGSSLSGMSLEATSSGIASSVFTFMIGYRFH